MNRNTFRSLLGLWIGGAHNEAKKLSDGVFVYTQFLSIPQNAISIVPKIVFADSTIGLNNAQQYPQYTNNPLQIINIAHNAMTRDGLNTIPDGVVQASQAISIPGYIIVCN